MADSLNILHVDMDAFYAAVEVLDNPSLKGKPVIVGGSRRRGVVCSATYEARAFGVKSAMPTAQAARLCPEGIFVPIRMDRYAEMSGQIMRILRSFTPLVEPLSMDEAFLDVSGAERLFGEGPQAGRRIKEKIRGDLGLIASVGVSFVKFLAKIGSDLKKPDGLCVIGPADVRRVLDPLPVSRLWGVGVKTEPRLHELGLRTIGDVHRADPSWLEERLGELGRHIAALARADDSREVVPTHDAKSIGAERTFERDLTTAAEMERELLEIAEEVGRRLREERLAARTIQIKVRFHDFRTITRSKTLDAPTDITREIFEVAREMLRARAGVARKRVRLLGIQSQQLREAGEGQGLLFGQDERRRQRRLDRAIDAVRQKLGDGAIVRARTKESGRPGTSGIPGLGRPVDREE